MRKKVTLICDVCLSRNYTALKHKDDKTRLVRRKYCKKCDAHTTHKESK